MRLRRVGSAAVVFTLMVGSAFASPSPIRIQAEGFRHLIEMEMNPGTGFTRGGVAFIAITTTFAIAFMRGEPLMMLFAGSLAGAVLGFLFYNFNPASIFMGDTGSMLLGYVLAAASIRSNQKSSTAVALIIPIVVLGLPIADTLLAMLRRAIRGRPVFSADREHVHHKLLALGLTHREAVLFLNRIKECIETPERMLLEV